EFDRWNLTNEKSFMEISTAVYAEDILALERLLTKYKIRWLLLDESVVTPAQDEKQLFYPQLKALLTSSQKIKLEKDFGWGLAVYKYFPDETFVLQERLSTYYGAADSTFKEFTDPIFNTYGNYASNGTKSYPFVGMTNYDESISRAYMSSDDTNIYLNNSLAFSTISADPSNNFFQYEVSLQLIGGAYSLEFSPVESSFEVDFAYNLGQVRPEVTAVSINGTTFAFVAGNLGTVLLDPSKAVEVALFSRSQNLLEGVDFFAVLESCSQVGTQTSYTIQRVTGGFVLSAQNVDACVTVDLAKYLGEQNEGNNFEVQIGAGDLARQEICVLDGTTGLCANPPLKSGRTYFKAVSGTDYRLRLFARGKKAVNHEVTVVYGDLQFYQLINEDLFNFKPGVVEQKELVLDTWRFKKDPSYSGNSTKLVNNPRICNSGSTSFDKSKISVIGSFGTPFIRYESHGESLCDSFEFPSFSHASGAVLEIRSRNVTGMPLRICLTNEYSKRCDLYVSLAKSSDFATQYFVVPPMGKGSGYTVSLSNLVFGTSVSINDLEYVGLIPFPYSLVKNIHKPLKQGTNLLVYNQAFEQGWIALCGFKPCVGEHVLVNNWANGWVFSHPVAAKAVFIVYWPQILEYAGIMASLGWFLVLAGKQVHRR
ncbi:hypothetical protein KJ605_01235, partial [Patescibacteria group bacterium]|nr:hypothetical protein [Patescibacteria group bacterium]